MAPVDTEIRAVQIQILTGPEQRSLLYFDADDWTAEPRIPPRLQLSRPLLLGKRADQHVVLPTDDPSVSRAHAILAPAATEPGAYLLRDCSRNGTSRVIFSSNGVIEERLRSELRLIPGSSETIRFGNRGCYAQISVSRAIPFGDNFLIGRLGAGGFGVVALAYATDFAQLCALKLLPTSEQEQHKLRELGLGYSGNGLAQRRANLLTAPGEVQVLARLNHRNIVRLFNCASQPIQFLRIDHVQGITLKELRLLAEALGCRLHPAFVAHLVAQSCDGLEVVHTLCDSLTNSPMSLVHRDVTPNNIMCTTQGTATLIDFGLAMGTLPAGTPAYVAPEVAQSFAATSPRSDLFAAALIGYELIMGAHPYRLDESIVEQAKSCQIPSLLLACPQAGADLAAVFDRALAKNPDDRQRTAGHLAQDLRAAVSRAFPAFAADGALGDYLRRSGLFTAGFPAVPIPVPSAPESVSWPRRYAALVREHSPTAPAPPLRSLLERGIGDRYRYICDLSPGIPSPLPSRYYAKILVEDATGGGAASRATLHLFGSSAGRGGLPLAEHESLLERANALDQPGSRLAPICDRGLCWADGPTFLVTPCYPQTLAQRLTARLTPHEQTLLGRGLAQALARTQEALPGCAHGTLDPQHLAIEEESATGVEVTLLSLCGPVGRPLPEVVAPEPWLAPELQRRNAEPEPPADVFSVGMTLLQLYGGDPIEAARHVREGRLPPVLSPQVPLPAQIGIFASLRADPRQRPHAAVLCSLMESDTLVLESQRVCMPRPDEDAPIPLFNVGPLRVRLRSFLQRGCTWAGTLIPLPLSLPLPGVPKDAAVLQLRRYPDSLNLLVASELEPAVRTYPRQVSNMGAFSPIYIAEDQPESSVLVGHHRNPTGPDPPYLRVYYASARGGRAAPQLALPSLGLTLQASVEQVRLTAVYLIDPRTGTVDVLCYHFQ